MQLLNYLKQREDWTKGLSAYFLRHLLSASRVLPDYLLISFYSVCHVSREFYSATIESI